MRKRFMLSAIAAICSFSAACSQNDYAGHYTRSLHDLMQDVSARWGVRFKYNVDTTGRTIPYADFRIRPYSLEETLSNICSYFDFKWWKDSGNSYKIKPYEYPRRHVDEGRQMIAHLNGLYQDRQGFDARRDSLRREVRRRLQFDQYRDSLVPDVRPMLGPVRHYDGYTVQNVRIETLPGEHVFASIYTPAPDKATRRRWADTPAGKGKYALIICPDGHFYGGRYRKDEQQRLATLARMGAVCVDFDLYGWGESEKELPADAHHTARAHVMQALNAEVMLDYMWKHRKDIDHKRVGVNGGSGGGTHTILLTVLDDRFTAAAPTVNLASHFDGGCPCESGMPIQLAAGGTCNAELIAMFAPRPLQVVSDGGDWTASVPTLEYPYLRRIYGFYGAADKVENVHLPTERHDYGINKRMANYDFFVRIFGLDRHMLDESKVTVEAQEVLTSGHGTKHNDKSGQKRQGRIK